MTLLIELMESLRAIEEELTEALEALDDDEPAFFYVSDAVGKISAALEDLDVCPGWEA